MFDYDELKAILTHLSPAAFGSALSIFTSKDEFTRTKKVVTFIFGISVAHFIGYGLVEYFKIAEKSPTASAIVFTVGFVGMNGLQIILINLPDWIKNLGQKWTGG